MVDKLQKIGAWLWRNKERAVLLVMLVILGYRGYQLVSPPPMPNWPRLQPPKPQLPDDLSELAEQNVELPPVPSPRPPADVPESYASLYQKNPFWYYSGSGSSQGDQEITVEQLNIQLLNIQQVQGRWRARLRTTSTTKWYDEGEQFEEFEVIRINPDNQTVEIRSERYGRNFTLQLNR